MRGQGGQDPGLVQTQHVGGAGQAAGIGHQVLRPGGQQGVELQHLFFHQHARARQGLQDLALFVEVPTGPSQGGLQRGHRRRRGGGRCPVQALFRPYLPCPTRQGPLQAIVQHFDLGLQLLQGALRHRPQRQLAAGAGLCWK